MTTPRLTAADAARRARTTVEAIDQALKSGDLRNLQAENVDKWVRSQIATIVVPGETS